MAQVSIQSYLDRLAKETKKIKDSDNGKANKVTDYLKIYSYNFGYHIYTNDSTEEKNVADKKWVNNVETSLNEFKSSTESDVLAINNRWVQNFDTTSNSSIIKNKKIMELVSGSTYNGKTIATTDQIGDISNLAPKQQQYLTLRLDPHAQSVTKYNNYTNTIPAIFPADVVINNYSLKDLSNVSNVTFKAKADAAGVSGGSGGSVDENRLFGKGSTINDKFIDLEKAKIYFSDKPIISELGQTVINYLTTPTSNDALAIGTKGIMGTGLEDPILWPNIQLKSTLEQDGLQYFAPKNSAVVKSTRGFQTNSDDTRSTLQLNNGQPQTLPNGDPNPNFAQASLDIAFEPDPSGQGKGQFVIDGDNLFKLRNMQSTPLGDRWQYHQGSVDTKDPNLHQLTFYGKDENTYQTTILDDNKAVISAKGGAGVWDLGFQDGRYLFIYKDTQLDSVQELDLGKVKEQMDGFKQDRPWEENQIGIQKPTQDALNELMGTTGNLSKWSQLEVNDEFIRQFKQIPNQYASKVIYDWDRKSKLQMKSVIDPDGNALYIMNLDNTTDGTQIKDMSKVVKFIETKQYGIVAKNFKAETDRRSPKSLVNVETLKDEVAWKKTAYTGGELIKEKPLQGSTNIVDQDSPNEAYIYDNPEPLAMYSQIDIGDMDYVDIPVGPLNIWPRAASMDMGEMEIDILINVQPFFTSSGIGFGKVDYKNVSTQKTKKVDKPVFIKRTIKKLSFSNEERESEEHVHFKIYQRGTGDVIDYLKDYEFELDLKTQIESGNAIVSIGTRLEYWESSWNKNNQTSIGNVKHWKEIGSVDHSGGINDGLEIYVYEVRYR